MDNMENSLDSVVRAQAVRIQMIENRLEKQLGYIEKLSKELLTTNNMLLHLQAEFKELQLLIKGER